MIYSVWHQGRGDYDYFESSKQQSKLNVEKPKHIGSRTLGSTVEQAAWPMPPDAHLIGHGPDAIGRVAVARDGSALGDDTTAASSSPLVTAGVLAVAAYALWHFVAKKPGRRSA
jgi:hypothetical protein